MVSRGAGDDDEGDEVRGGAGRETEDEMRSRIVAELDEERRVLERELKELKERTDNLQLQVLPEEQRSAIFAAPDFSAFIEGSSRIVQRALSDGYDYIKDYAIGGESGYDESEGQKVKFVCAFSDERWTNKRSVTDLDWSSKVSQSKVSTCAKSLPVPRTRLRVIQPQPVSAQRPRRHRCRLEPAPVGTARVRLPLAV
jgi:dynein intermediate chain